MLCQDRSVSKICQLLSDGQMTTTLTERADPAGLTDAVGTVKAANKGLSIAHYQTPMLLTGNRNN